ncbi:AMP-binding protein [Burkholderiaceae bacterium FT117]|uniref:AMP-binding protein n=1 Tax=Zeimonas sediminis TaxID=2944268 RepID=UPI002342D948|nr:AMP-binding protein [Zeimonas sediminis]MCM5570334.1 AMP-binding protein [Zeimonas sediminis]
MDRITLSAMLAHHRPREPGAPVLTDDRRSLDLAAFEALVRRAVAWLHGQGIGRGDRVGVWLPNRVEWLVLLFALARLGATLVSINTRYRAAEVAYLLERSGARLLVLQGALRGVDFPAVLAGIEPGTVPALERIAVLADPAARPAHLLGRPTLGFHLADLPPDPGPDDPAAAHCGDPESIAILFTTSGTTRRPKLVMHTQHTLACHAAHVARANRLDAPGACLLGALPLCGTFGLTGVLAALSAGAPVVLVESFDGANAARLVRERAVTHAYGSDEMFRRMLDAAPGPRPFPSARVFGFAAFQPGAAEFAKAAVARDVPMLGLYGSSEVQALFAIQDPAEGVDARVEGGGVPAAPDASVRIRDMETGELVGPGIDGEIEIRAPGNFVGYLNDAQATASAIDPEGFFRTGDIGHLRSDGSFVYLTRRGDAIRLGGFLVNPGEIEDELGALAGVAGAAVIAVEIDGRARCVAFVVREAGAAIEEAALIEAARNRMAGFKVPARVWFVDALPVTASANGTKVQRARLREMAMERLDAPAGGD